MIVTDLFKSVSFAYRGSDDDAPAEGTVDWDLYLDTANRLQRKWAKDPKNKWASLWEDRAIGTVSAGTGVFELESDFTKPSDEVIVTTTENQTVRYTLIKPQERNFAYKSAYVSGRNPQVLTFTDEFYADEQEIGGTVTLGAYYVPSDLKKARDTITVDDPDWLVLAMASDLAGNDLTYSDKAVDLNNRAEELYRNMSVANRSGTYNNPRTTPTRVNAIRGYSSRHWGRM